MFILKMKIEQVQWFHSERQVKLYKGMSHRSEQVKKEIKMIWCITTQKTENETQAVEI